MNLNELTEVCEPTLVVVPVTLEVVQNGWIDVCQEDIMCLSIYIGHKGLFFTSSSLTTATAISC